ncbi:unnamed protein product [Enterobius vermicularis]|uniref:WD_REPEATS_REGION domain-containing protein n=1 Tax=Enterobius vermicularis TaxID=51028 RepID=A0A0N4VQ42_ENTVE|nr:unnamed protein product [Enterobius vermicularis]
MSHFQRNFLLDHIIRFYERRGYRQKYYLKNQIRAPYVGWAFLDVITIPGTERCIYMYQCKMSPEEQHGAPSWTALNIIDELDSLRFAIFSIRFNQESSELIAGSSSGHIYIYDLKRGQRILDFIPHEDDVNAVCFGASNKNLFFSAGDDAICKVWDRRLLNDSDHPVGSFAGHRAGITFIDSKADDRYILTNSKDQTIKLWDIRCFSSADTAENLARQSFSCWDYRVASVPEELFNSEPLEGDGSVYTFRGGHSVLHTLVRARFSPVCTGQRYVYVGSADGNCTGWQLFINF